MYNSDKPIKYFEEDFLGRGYFAKQLGDTILSIGSNDTLTIGLYGKWGSGKTSIINMAIEEIENKSSNKIKAPLIIRFAPWNFTDNQNLIIQFFKQLKNELKIKNYKEFSKGLGEALDSYSGAIELAQSVPGIGEYVSILKMTINFLSKKLKGINANDGIAATKHKLIQELKLTNKKIIVVIDDIDRLSNEQIRMVFQLVKEVGNLPNITYLLAMDKDVVTRALKEVQYCDGEEYLEKIVQVPFEIPKLDKDKILDYFDIKIDEVLFDIPEIRLDNAYYAKIYWPCIYPYINTVRDINRVINILQFKMSLVCEEVNFADMIAITVLQVIRPKIYHWILENKDIICGGSGGYDGVVYNIEQDKKKKQYIDKLKNIGGVEALEVIATLFPKIDKEVNNNYEVINDDNLRKGKRISDPDRFEIYFNLDVSDVCISNSLFIRSIYDMNRDELQELLFKINDCKNIIPYLRELKCHADEVPKGRICLLIEILFKNMQYFSGEVQKSFLSFSVQQYVEWSIDALLNRIESSNEKFKVFATIIKNADLKTLNFMGIYINRIELGYGRLAGKDEDKRKQIISIEELEKLEVMYIQRINYLIANKKSLFECNSLLFIIYLWSNFNKNSCKRYIEELLKEPSNVLKFIVRMSSEWKGTGGRGWNFSEESYSEFISKDEVIDTINSYFKGEIVEEFSQEEKCKLASFIMLNIDEYDNHVSEKEALDYIKQFKYTNENM